MKTYLRYFLAVVSLAALSGCANFMGGGAKSLAGTWTNSMGTVWTINADNTFTVDRDHDGKVDINGTYKVEGDTFTITHNEGKKVPNGCDGPGEYKFKRQGNDLTFTVVNDDPCKDRKKNVTSPWHMKM